MECRPEFDVAAKDVIVVQPSAGSNNRSLPLSILRPVVSECLRTGREVHLVTRSYPRWFEGRRMHDEETIPDDIALNPGVVWHRNLSVPATLNLVKNCGFFAGCHSSLLQAAWFEGKPVFALYPSNQVDWQPEKLGSGYSFGAAFPQTRHQSFEKFDAAELRSHLIGSGMHMAVKGSGVLHRAGATGALAQSAQRRHALGHARFTGRLGKKEMDLTLYPGGWARVEAIPAVRRWETTQTTLRLLLADGSYGVELAETEKGLAGIFEGQELTIAPDLRQRRYLVCGLQRTCTNLIQHYFNNYVGAPRVTLFHGGQAYWKHGWLPTAEHLRDIFVIVCMRHPLHWLVACYDYFVKEAGKDRSICPNFRATWTFEEWLENKHYAWPTPAERWNVMNGHWLERAGELGINAVVVRAEDCQTEWMQRVTFSRVLAQYDPLLSSQLTEGVVPNRLTNTNQQTAKPMDPTAYLHHTYLERYTAEMKTKALRILDKKLMAKLGYE